MKTGIFGGSFNPPHRGHLQLCTYAKQQMNLDRVILVPTGDNPLKLEAKNTPTRTDRLNMTKALVENMDGFEVDSTEIDKEGVSYTVDTLRSFRKKYRDDFYFIIGSDILFMLDKWKKFDELARLTYFLCVKRRDVDNKEILKEAEYLNTKYSAGIILLETYAVEGISSTKVRKEVLDGKNFEEYVTPKVYQYIKQHNLYNIGNTK